MQTAIRNAIPEDLDQLSGLFDLYRIFYQMESDLQSARKFLNERIKNKDSIIFVAETEINALVGFVQLYPLFSSTRMKRLWLLNDLYVCEEYRSKGISIALIDQAKRLCKLTNGCGIILETAKSNQVGNQLYPKTGFMPDADHNYYSWDAV